SAIPATSTGAPCWAPASAGRACSPPVARSSTPRPAMEQRAAPASRGRPSPSPAPRTSTASTRTTSTAACTSCPPARRTAWGCRTRPAPTWSPALPESWDVSEDELTYTFHLREANWSNGDPISADDAVWSFQRLLSPTGAGSGYTTGASSYLPSAQIKGAADYQSGALDSWDDVGISAPDESTVVIELEDPNPDLLLNMTHYSMSVLHPATVEAEPQDWTLPENWVGNGPYVLTNWVPNST